MYTIYRRVKGRAIERLITYIPGASKVLLLYFNLVQARPRWKELKWMQINSWRGIFYGPASTDIGSRASDCTDIEPLVHTHIHKIEDTEYT